MTICINTSNNADIKDSKQRDGLTALCPDHKTLVGKGGPYIELVKQSKKK